MKTYNTRRVYRVRCQSGIIGWRTRLGNNYKSYADWKYNAEMWGLDSMLGFKSPREAWDANPVVEGSVNPSDFRKVKP